MSSSLVDGVKDIYDKVFSVDDFNIDNLVSKLYYRITVTILVVFSVLLSLTQVSHHLKIIKFLIKIFFISWKY